MKPAVRHAWILEYLRQHPRAAVSVLDREFSDAYIEATGARSQPMFFGADRCPQLGRDLGTLHAAGYLRRFASGLPAGDASMGFPR